LADVREELVNVLAQREKCSECGRKMSDADLIRLGDFFAKYGLGAAKGYDEGLVEALGLVVRGELSDEVWERIRAKWVTVIGLHVRGGT